MKLYTEEQVRVAMSLSFLKDLIATENEIIDSLKFIELPSDEEILMFALENTKNINEQILFNNGAVYVCKLIEEQIKQ